MKIKQYVYFALWSEDIAGDEIEQRIGLPPDETVVRGSRIPSPPHPARHGWKVLCDEPGLTIDEQVHRVIVRLEPYRKPIRDLIAGPNDVEGVLQAVRYMNGLAAQDGEEEESVEANGLKKLSGQHQLLGWRLEHDVMRFLVDVGASIDFDEYG